jgi:hypothetical protein
MGEGKGRRDAGAFVKDVAGRQLKVNLRRDATGRRVPERISEGAQSTEDAHIKSMSTFVTMSIFRHAFHQNKVRRYSIAVQLAQAASLLLRKGGNAGYAVSPIRNVLKLELHADLHSLCSISRRYSVKA